MDEDALLAELGLDGEGLEENPQQHAQQLKEQIAF